MAKNTIIPPSLMEPMLPTQGQRELVDLAVTLVENSARMTAQLHPLVQDQLY